MTRDEALTSLRRAIHECLDLDADMVEETSTFTDDLEVDSLDVIDVIFALETEHHVQFAEEELRSLTTAGDVVDLILAKTASASSAQS